MTDVLIGLVAVLGLVSGMVLGRLLGRASGKRAGKEELHQDELRDQAERMEAGRASVAKGRNAGTPAERLRDNDAAW